MNLMLIAGVIGLSLAVQGCNRNEETAADAGAPAAGAMPNMPMPGAPATEAQGAIYATTGEVTAIGADSVTIHHQPVAELNWPVMFMTFKAPDAAMLGGLSVGTHVAFSFRKEAVNMLTEIRPQ